MADWYTTPILLAGGDDLTPQEIAAQYRHRLAARLRELALMIDSEDWPIAACADAAAISGYGRDWLQQLQARRQYQIPPPPVSEA